MLLGLCTDFDRNGGTYMILRGQDKLLSEQINQVQRVMLASVKIPNHLKLDIREIDFEVSLYYEITGKRMLSQCLKSDKLVMTEFYGLLLQIATVLDDCKQFMLTPDNYILHEDYIFVEESLHSGMLYLTYVPFMENVIQEPIGQVIVNLITKMITSVSEMKGTGIQQIIRFCCDDLFSITEFKRRLVMLLASNQSEVPPQATLSRVQPKVNIKEYLSSPIHSEISFEIPFASHQETPKSFGDRVNQQDSQWDFDIQNRHASDRDGVAEGIDGIDDNYNSDINKSKSTYILLAITLIDALCWKFLYFDRPSSLTMYVCLGLTLTLVAIFVFVRSGKMLCFKLGGRDVSQNWRWRDSEDGILEDRVEDSFGDSSLPPKRHEHSIHPMYSSGNAQLLKSMQSPGVDHSIMARSYTASASSIQEKRSVEGGFPIQEMPLVESIQQMQPVQPMQTVVLGKLPPTVQESVTVPSYSLERHQGSRERAEIIPLPIGSFVIGRSEDIVQYVERATGISRAHVELMITKDGCTIKDLGSINGTKLMEEELAPYKEYPISVGDTFTLAEQSYTLCVNSKR